MTARDIVKFIQSRRWTLSDEKSLQASIAEQMDAAGILYEREVRLAPGDIVDFMVGSIAVEVKIGGQRRAIFRQCMRYCEHDRVSDLVLATNVAIGLPGTMVGKSVSIASLGRAWL